MAFIVENIRLKELVGIVNANRPFFDDFVRFIAQHGYSHVRDFINEPRDDAAQGVIRAFLELESPVVLYDGLCRPYDQPKAHWYFLSWLLRDAAAQRLGPLVAQAPGESTIGKEAYLLNQIRKFVAPLFPDKTHWEWSAISEVFLARLEGSRRALKGNLFEAIVRRCLESLFAKHGIKLRIGEKEVRLHEETYDVPVYGKTRAILIPVKTRETMGGGHALLFTRDIHKSITVAEQEGYTCLPVVIAESWGGDLDGLACKNHIYIQTNPNQVAQIEPVLCAELEKLVSVFKEIES